MEAEEQRRQMSQVEEDEGEEENEASLRLPCGRQKNPQQIIQKLGTVLHRFGKKWSLQKST